MKLLIIVFLTAITITGCAASKPMTAFESNCSNYASSKANEVYERHTNSISGKADASSLGAIVAAAFARNKAGKQAYKACMGGYSPKVLTASVETNKPPIEQNISVNKTVDDNYQKKREFEAYYEKRRAEEIREAELKKLYKPLKSK